MDKKFLTDGFVAYRRDPQKVINDSREVLFRSLYRRAEEEGYKVVSLSYEVQPVMSSVQYEMHTATISMIRNVSHVEPHMGTVTGYCQCHCKKCRPVKKGAFKCICDECPCQYDLL